MPAPSKNFTTIADSSVDGSSPLDTTLVTAIRDNDQHLEEWLGKDYAAATNHDHNGTNSALISNFSNVAAGFWICGRNDIERTTASTSATMLREMKVGRGGTFRIRFDLHSSIATIFAYGAVYRNGNIVGVTQSTDSTSYVTFSEDIAGWATNDLLQIYIWSMSGAWTVYVANVVISADQPFPVANREGY